MNGFVNIVNGFSLSAIQALKTKADDIYITDTPPPEEETGEDYPGQITGVTLANLASTVAGVTEDTRIMVNSGTTANITLDGNGTHKVVVEASTPFGASVTNVLTLNGDLITVRKLNLHSVQVYGSDVKLLRNKWTNLPIDLDAIKLNSVAWRTEIGWNLFDTRASADVNRQVIEQRVIENEIDPVEPYSTHIHHNHFKDIASSVAQTEVYLSYCQIAHDDDTPVYEPKCPPNNIIIEYNLYDNCEADGKFVDMKTNGFIVRYNTVTNGSRGYFTMRHANDCEVYNNICTVDDASLCWITMSGANHSVYNNIVTGDTFKEAIMVQSGTVDTEPIKDHQDVVNAFIAFNTIHSKTSDIYGILVGRAAESDGGPTDSIPPSDSTIAHNLMIGCVSSLSTNNSVTPPNITYDNNVYVDGDSWSGSAGGLGGNLTKLTSYASMNLNDQFANGVNMPQAGSELLGIGTTAYPDVTVGAMLTDRPTAQSLGATEQYNAGSTVNMVLTASDVGVDA